MDVWTVHRFSSEHHSGDRRFGGSGKWIVSSYSIGYALSTVIYSRLSDVLPIRRLLWIGLAILGLSSVFGIMATNFQALLMARIAQYAGGHDGRT
jgi:predicted MFS family arabinose efflux permease